MDLPRGAFFVSCRVVRRFFAAVLVERPLADLDVPVAERFASRVADLPLDAALRRAVVARCLPLNERAEPVAERLRLIDRRCA